MSQIKRASSSSSRSCLASHWLNTDYSDAEALVVLHNGRRADSCEVVARLPTHRLVLTASSPYFAALFERWHRSSRCSSSAAVQQEEQQATTPALEASEAEAPPPCVLHVTQWEDVDAAITLLHCCYTGAFEPLTPQERDALLTPAASALRKHNSGGSAGQPGCWQQLAVRTLVLADRLDCSAVVTSCVEALSGRLFAHQMSLEAAMAVLWLLPEALARQEVVEPLQHMANVRVIQEFGSLDLILADPNRAAQLQQLPGEAVLSLLGSAELRAWNEGAALAALDVWVNGPVGSAASDEQLAALGRAVRLPLVVGALLSAASLLMPQAVFAGWPLDVIQRYYR